MSAAHRTGTTKAGPQTAQLKPCAKSEWHGFHPTNEPCPYCTPAAPAAAMVTKPLYIDPVTGDLVAVGSVRVDSLAPGGFLAQSACGCRVTGKHRMFYGIVAGRTIALCSAPSMYTNPRWVEVT